MTMKKIALATLSTGLLFSVFANPNHIEAVGTESSEATVEFEAPDDAVAPVDPRDPSEPNEDITDEEDGNITGSEGPLTLDYISHIDFGLQDITTAERTIFSETDSPYIQVSDRRGTGGGWNVTAQASNFNDGSQDTLPGSVITFANGATDSTSTTPEPVVNDSIELSTGDDAAENVVTAAAREEGAALDTAQGLGTWVVSWLEDNEVPGEVTLYIPESATTAGEHEATIDWTLTAGPGGTEVPGEPEE